MPGGNARNWFIYLDVVPFVSIGLESGGGKGSIEIHSADESVVTVVENDRRGLYKCFSGSGK